jgi:hypothetical protein
MRLCACVTLVWSLGCSSATEPIVVGDQLPAFCSERSVTLERVFRIELENALLVRVADHFVAHVRTTAGVELVDIDDGGVEISRRTLALPAPESCDFATTTGFDTDGTDLYLGRSCNGRHELWRAGETGWELYTELPFGGQLAIDALGPTLWIDGQPSAFPVEGGPVDLGATAHAYTFARNGTNHDVSGGAHFGSADAFEAGMRNRLIIARDGDPNFCLFDAEDVPGLRGQGGVRVVADGERAWLSARDGAMAEFRWRDE